MSTFREIAAVTALNLRNLPQRIGPSFVIVIGITGVIAVLLSVLALATGFRQTMEQSASPERAIVLSRGAETEAASGIPRAAIAAVANASGIERDSRGDALVSAETLIVAPVARKADGLDAYISLRGVGSQGMSVRPEVRLIAGRMFKPAVRELIVGRAAQGRFAGLEIGNRIVLRGGDWIVVGVFESGGSAHESGLIADAQTVMAAYKLLTFASVIAKISTEADLDTFKNALAADPTLALDVQRETDYVASTSKSLHRLLDLITYTIGSIMAIGALFGALNTMYSAVSARSVEIATLRALGFGSGAVMTSVFIEALLLAALGAILGTMLAYGLFNGNAISTMGGTAYGSQLVYRLTITNESVAAASTLALVLGFCGGLLPALRAARMPIAAALRDS